MVVNLYFDGGSRGNPGPAGFGAYIESGIGKKQVYGYIENATNNVAEYTALIEGLKKVKSSFKSFEKLNIFGDSKLVISQIKGEWKVKNDDLKKLIVEAHKILENFNWDAKWIPREKNEIADMLANKAMDTKSSSKTSTNTKSKEENVVNDTIKALNDNTPQNDRTDMTPHQRAQSLYSGIATEKPGAKRTTIFFVRHGESDDTAKIILSGSAVPGPNLSEIGLAETLESGKLIKKIIDSPVWPMVSKPVKIIASPMTRCIDTAKQVQKSFPELDITVDENFKEFNFGIYDHKSKEEVAKENYEFLYKWTLGDKDVKAEKGDSFSDIQNRVKNGIEKAVNDYYGKTVIVSTHSVATRAILTVSLGLSTEQMMRLRIMPASVTVLSYWKDDETGKVVFGDSYPKDKPYFIPELIAQNMFQA